MQDHTNHQRSLGFAVITLFIAALVTGCTNPSTLQGSQAIDSPASLKDKGSLVTGVPVDQPPSKPRYTVVAHGQSLNGIAHAHHVGPAALAAANHLRPPYKLKVGSRLVLPASGPPPIQPANASSAPASPAPLPPVTPTASPQKDQKTVAAAPQPVPPSAALPDGIPKESIAPEPLQMQAQAAASVLPPAPPVLPPRNPAAALPLPGEPAVWPTGSPIVNKPSESPTN